LTFFLGNNLSPILAEGLRAFGEDVRHLREVFPPDTPDELEARTMSRASRTPAATMRRGASNVTSSISSWYRSGEMWG
jgi:hypothetical protein